MTVIILARASDGLVLAGDGRTCNPAENAAFPLAKKLDPRVTQKVRIHTACDGGFVTASSGRARIGDRSIADIERDFWKERASDDDVPSPQEFLNYFRSAAREHNLGQRCDCAEQIGDCVVPIPCFECGDEFKPDCKSCCGERKEIYWVDNGEDGCPCSPEGGLDASVASKYADATDWCRCRPTRENSAVQWLCVSFGSGYAHGYGEPITAEIVPDHDVIPVFEPLDADVWVGGELASDHAFDIRVESSTVVRAHAMSEEGPTDLLHTIARVRELLRGAYTEATDNAVLRVLEPRDGQYTAASLDVDDKKESIRVHDLANAIRLYEADRGENVDVNVGDPGIGGTARLVTITASGKVDESLLNESEVLATTYETEL